RARLGSEYPRPRQPSRYQGGPPESHQLLGGSFRRGEEGGRRRQVPGCGKERDQAAEIRILDELRSLPAGQYRALLHLLDNRAVASPVTSAPPSGSGAPP